MCGADHQVDQHRLHNRVPLHPEDLADEQAIASQTVQLLGANVCNGSFALEMDEICREGVTPP